MRVVMTLENKKKRVEYYSNSHNDVKALVEKIRVASDPKLKYNLQKLVHEVSVAYNVCKFYGCQTMLIKAYNTRVKRLVSFQQMGSNLVDMA
jgi:hypothetical protein